MLVSVIVGLLNEEKYLPRLIDDFKNQTYSFKKIELIFIDGMSTDRSWEILTKFKEEYKKIFYDVVLLKNPKKILSSGMNIGIKAAKGECFLKVDCHSHIPENFIENNVNVIQEGEHVCGGPRPNIIDSNSIMADTLLLVEENMFGSGIASYRKANTKKYVSSVFQGMYRREVFEKVGLIDELVGRVEDNEIHYRIRNNGYKIRYSNDIYSEQYTRPTVKGMLKQKYSNGYWIGKVSHIYPKCFSFFHFIPFLFVLAILISSLLAIFVAHIFLSLLFIAYIGSLLLITIIIIFSNKFNINNILIPFLIFMVHTSYGIGTLIGIIKGFSWRNYYLKNRKIEQLKKRS